MAELILHTKTAENIEKIVNKPSHAILITGSTGIGKHTVSLELTGRLLGLPYEKLSQHPHVLSVGPIDEKAISIESIREMQHKLVLTIPGAKGIARVVIIENAHLMTTEAQNALLKTLEEPPLNTMVILTARSTDSLLPTIQSRVQLLPIISPETAQLKAYLEDEGYESKDIDMALMLGGNLPGLILAMLNSDESHPLFQATAEARRLLQSKAYERLLSVDILSKQKQLCADIAFILGQMARTALQRGHAGNAAANNRWKQIMSAAFEAERQLGTNAQTKLIMTNFLLAL